MDLLILEGFPTPSSKPNRKACSCKTTENKSVTCNLDVSAYPRRMGNTTEQKLVVFNAFFKSEALVSFKTPAEKDCKCFPTEPIRPCSTLDCECIQRDLEACSRIVHKSFCPSYKHKETCPVTMINDEELIDPLAPPPPPEEEVVALPYGLPPLKFGPCPVPGRPCSGPEGAARLLKNVSSPPLPPANNVTGKITCSKEFERIKRAMLDFEAEEKQPEFICLNKFQVDTEKRCCDVEQRLLNLLGKSCCAEHKLAAQALFKERAEREASERRNALPPS